jgi:hypothetical protein
VGCWDQTLSFYDLGGQQHEGDISLGYDPCSISTFSDQDFLLVAGSNRKVSIHTRTGKFLRVVCEMNDWVWAVKSQPGQLAMAVGTNDGTISRWALEFSTVHGLYQDRYAYRGLMSEVIVQHLITEQKMKLSLDAYIKKIALFKGRLAVQTPDKITIFETVNDVNELNYRVLDIINKPLECNLLVVTSSHITLCQERKIQLYNFKGRKIREWVLEDSIKYIRVVGGSPGRESLLLGLRSGMVFKIFIDNHFPILLVHHTAAIRCLDISLSRKKLGVVDVDGKVSIYDLATKLPIFEDSNANSVAWNAQIDDMFCFTGKEQLCIKTGDFPVSKQFLPGYCVGFKGSKIFVLNNLNMQTVDIPQTASMLRYLDLKDYQKAYAIACLGVTVGDWRTLALSALGGLSFDIARKAFIRVRDVNYVDLLDRIQIARLAPGHDDNIFRADILAFQGKFTEAAQIYLQHNHRRQAFEMYLDIRDWAKAKDVVEQMNSQRGGNNDAMLEMIKQQAGRLIEAGELQLAAEMLWACRDYTNAIQIMSEHDWNDQLMVKVRNLDAKSNRTEMILAAETFRKKKLLVYAREIFEKLEDIKELVMLMVASREWDEAFALAKDRPELLKDIYLPYAEWLALNDRFDEARDAFALAGRPDESMKMLETLTYNAVIESRFRDAGYNYWLLASQHIKPVADSEAAEKELARRANEEKSKKSETKGSVRRGSLATEDDEEGKSTKKEKAPEKDKLAIRFTDEQLRAKLLTTAAKQACVVKFEKFLRSADLYFAFHNIYRYCDQPFVADMPEQTLFQTAAYLMNAVRPDEVRPFGMSLAYILYTLSKQGNKLGAFKLCREVNTRLSHMRVRDLWRDQLDVSNLILHTKPVRDSEDVVSVCYRCFVENPVLNREGDQCSTCHHPFQRSFVDFSVLPLVEFELENGIPAEEAMELIATDPRSIVSTRSASAEESTEQNSLQIDDDGLCGGNDHSLFAERMNSYQQRIDGTFPSIEVDRKILLSLHPSEAFVRRYPGGAYKYYCNVTPDQLPVVMCSKCQHFFLQEVRDLNNITSFSFS